MKSGASLQNSAVKMGKNKTVPHPFRLLLVWADMLPPAAVRRTQKNMGGAFPWRSGLQKTDFSVPAAGVFSMLYTPLDNRAPPPPNDPAGAALFLFQADPICITSA